MDKIGGEFGRTVGQEHVRELAEGKSLLYDHSIRHREGGLENQEWEKGGGETQVGTKKHENKTPGAVWGKSIKPEVRQSYQQIVT